MQDVKAGEEVLTLDEKTSKLVPRKVNALLDHGIKPIYEMATEDGRAINTTAKHPYFVRNDQSIILMPSSARIQVLPLNLSENLSDHCRNKDSHLEISGGCTRITTIAGNSAGGNKDVMKIKDFQDTENLRFSRVFKKSLSNDNIALPSSHANRYNLEFLTPFSAYLISMPLSESDLINLASASSSEKNLNFKVDKPLTSEFFSSVVQGSPDMLPSQGRISFEDIFKGFSCLEHFKDLRDPDSGAPESGLSTANFAVRDNKLVNFSSHINSNDNSIYKTFDKKFYATNEVSMFKSYDNSNELGTWIEVRYLEEGMEIAVPDYSTGAIKWEKIGK